MNSILAFLSLALLSGLQAFAVEVTLVHEGDTTFLKGEFQNGTSFEYRVDVDQRATLYFIDRGIKSIRSTQSFSFMPGLADESRTYEIYEAEEAVFFRNSNNAFFLTSAGKFEAVFPEAEKLSLNQTSFVRTAMGLSKDYAIFSAPYKSPVDMIFGQTGKTYVVRLSDGATVLLRDQYIKQEALNNLMLEEKSFGFGAIRFELDALFAKKAAETTETAIIKREPQVTKKPAPKAFEVRVHVLENRNKIVTELRDGSTDTGSVFFEDKNGHRKRITKGKVYAYPGKTTEPNEKKLFQIHTDREVLIVNDQGEVTRLEANFKQIERHNGAFGGTETLVEHAGRQYLVVSFTYNGSPGQGPGETFIVRDDGVSLKLDFKSYNLKPDYANFRVDDGILQLRGSYRLIDLNAFEAEATFEPKITAEPEKTIEEFEKMFRDMTFDAQSGKRAFEVMDQKALREMRIALQKQEARSVVILGESGTGKTELVRSFIQDMAEGKYPELPRTWRVFQFDPVTLNSGAQFVGMIEQRMENVMRTAKSIPMYLFIDEMHSMRGIGTHSNNSNDVFQYIKTALASGEVRIIGTSTLDEFNDAFKGDAALDRRINKVHKGEPRGEEVGKAVTSWAQKHRKRVPSREVLDYAIRVAGEFNAEGAQPSKAIQLMEEVYAEMTLDGRGKQAPTRADVDAAAQKLYQADPAQFDLKDMAKKLDMLESVVNSRVAGHKQVKAEIFNLIRQAYAGMHDPGKPRVSYIAGGPRGSGKTSLVYAIAEALGLPVRRFEMNTYREGDGPRLMREMVEALRKNAFTIFLVDEIEKAPVDVAQAYLGVMDSGLVSTADKINTASSGGTRSSRVSALNAMVFATTNAGAEMMAAPQKSEMGFGKSHADTSQTGRKRVMTSAITKELLIRAGLPAPLIDRFKGAGWMDAATPEEYREVVRIQVKQALDKVSERLEAKVTLANEAKYIDWLMEHYKPGTSNRTALAQIQDTIRATLAEARLSGKIDGAKAIVLRLEKGVLRVATCEEILGE